MYCLLLSKPVSNGARVRNLCNAKMSAETDELSVSYETKAEAVDKHVMDTGTAHFASRERMPLEYNRSSNLAL